MDGGAVRLYRRSCWRGVRVVRCPGKVPEAAARVAAGNCEGDKQQGGAQVIVTMDQFEYGKFLTRSAALAAVEAVLATEKSTNFKLSTIKGLLYEQSKWEEGLLVQAAEAENQRREMNNKLVQEENKRKLFLERKKNGEL
jgi:hypothetical protein